MPASAKIPGFLPGRLAVALCCMLAGCTPPKNLPAENPLPTLLIAQAQFSHEQVDGRSLPKPGPALLTIKQKTPGGWVDTVIEDPESRVFHKAMIFSAGSKKQILTIGATEALLKLWEYRNRTWQQTVLWHPVFGGTWDRLRDVEVADVDGNGTPEIVVATHDQGVVAVLRNAVQGWQVSELDREPGIFVHEVEIGDVDGDGLNEIVTTPSKPNKAEGGPQPGKIVMYKWNGSQFSKTIVEASERTHAKEILVCDLDGRGIATLFAVWEAETQQAHGGQTTLVETVTIKQYAFTKNGAVGKVIARLNDYQCRFLTAGDVDGDGTTELIAAAMKSGIWMLKPQASSWEATAVDTGSSGYEHAVCIDDLDGDGRTEIYVASDDQHELRLYQWSGGRFLQQVLGTIPEDRITWNVTAGQF